MLTFLRPDRFTTSKLSNPTLFEQASKPRVTYCFLSKQCSSPIYCSLLENHWALSHVDCSIVEPNCALSRNLCLVASSQRARVGLRAHSVCRSLGQPRSGALHDRLQRDRCQPLEQRVCERDGQWCISAYADTPPIFQLPEFIFKSFNGCLIKKTGIIGDYERRKCCDVIRESDATIKIFECTHDCLYD